ncbi:MAG: hypothetical protein P8Z37_12925 [Acidobacteriota bacterium]
MVCTKCLTIVCTCYEITHRFGDSTVFELPYILNRVETEGRWEGEIKLKDGKASTKSYGLLLPLAGSHGKESGYLLLIRQEEGKTGPGLNLGYPDAARQIRSLVHDLNNSLAVIMASSQLLALHSGSSERARSDIEKLNTEVGKVALTVETLHKFACSLCDSSESSSPGRMVKNEGYPQDRILRDLP